MRLLWTRSALSDLTRLYEFLAPENRAAAAATIRLLANAPRRLLANPRIGQQLRQFESREVRRLVVRQYEIRYEIRDDVIHVLRLWHTREDR